MKDHAIFNSMVLCYRYKIPKELVNLYRGGVLDMSKNEPGNREKNGAVTIVSFSVFFYAVYQSSCFNAVYGQ